MMGLSYGLPKAEYGVTIFKIFIFGGMVGNFLLRQSVREISIAYTIYIPK